MERLPNIFVILPNAFVSFVLPLSGSMYIYGHLPICKNFFHKFDKLECFHISELLVINV